MKVNFQSQTAQVSSSSQAAEVLKLAQSSLEALLKRNDLGFFKLPQMDHLWQQSEDIAPKFGKKFKHFVWVGIGGSSLGPKCMAQALGVENVYFLENPDIKTIQNLNAKISNWKEVGFVFVSKSGTTIETLATLDYYLNKLEKAQLKISEQSLVITELKASSLYDWAKNHQVPVLEIPLNVGGRFSVLSSIGQAFLGMLGKSVADFKKGAESVLSASYKDQTLLPMLAFYIEGLKQKDVLTYFWYYSDSTYQLGKWLEQLWAESLGKKDSPHYTASVPIAVLGANDQHSVLQQMMESPMKKSVVIHRATDSEESSEVLTKSNFKETKSLEGKAFSLLLKTEARAMTESQKEIQNHTMELQLDKMTAFELGQYFMTYKLIVGAMGEFMKIDAFNQPGVELGKILAKKMLN